MPNRGQMIGNSKVLEEFCKLCIIKLVSIIHNNGLWQAKTIDDRFLNKITSLYFGDTCERFCFYLLHEVVNCITVITRKGLRISILHWTKS